MLLGEGCKEGGGTGGTHAALRSRPPFTDILDSPARHTLRPGHERHEHLGLSHLSYPPHSIPSQLKPRERPAQLEERLHIIRFVPVTSSIPSITTSIILTGLKNIFQRQLPKMPREYITRLVFDRNHWSVAIVKKGYQVVGGITYRPFENREFGEIVFCAITGTEQVRVGAQWLVAFAHSLRSPSNTPPIPPNV